MNARVKLLKAFEDNYLFLILNDDEKTAIAVDPGDGHVIEDFIERSDYKLSHILITHHHPDHTGGNALLKEKYNCPVYANEMDKKRIPAANHFIKLGDELEINGFQFQIYDCPGHTIGHIAFFESNFKWLFCGDTIFSIGCGKMFEGSPEVFWQTIEQLKKLPKDSLIFCAHEYTLKNIAYAKTLDSVSEDLISYEKDCRKKREQDIPTIPTSLELEKKLNPFLNCANASEFKEVRKGKDEF